jgi:hypothetical protein
MIGSIDNLAGALRAIGLLILAVFLILGLA